MVNYFEKIFIVQRRNHKQLSNPADRYAPDHFDVAPFKQ